MPAGRTRPWRAWSRRPSCPGSRPHQRRARQQWRVPAHGSAASSQAHLLPSARRLPPCSQVGGNRAQGAVPHAGPSRLETVSDCLVGVRCCALHERLRLQGVSACRWPQASAHAPHQRVSAPRRSACSEAAGEGRPPASFPRPLCGWLQAGTQPPGARCSTQHQHAQQSPRPEGVMHGLAFCAVHCPLQRLAGSEQSALCTAGV